ncbi:type IV pilus modification PilV family protein [Arsukibacterium sp.]|uniref:type IV pilus modification PilV family protein n=1 Tax=Arsukibacterium sp. TaxID=1977258 RepID=UPI002FDB1A83
MRLNSHSIPRSVRRSVARGVTLIELIAGIVVLAVALSLITSVLGPLYIKSADPWHQVRAAELGHSLMNEILARSFDEQSSRSGSLLRCNESSANVCTPVANFGPDGSESRLSFNDVDDFDGFIGSGDTVLSNILDENLAASYRAYQVAVQVRYAGAEHGFSNGDVKRIVVTVITPTGAQIQFSGYKGNW